MPPLLVGLLSLLLPGLGQAILGQRVRALLVALPALALYGVLVGILLWDPTVLTSPQPESWFLASLLLLDVVAAIYHLWATLDAYRLARRAREDVLWVFVPTRKPLVAASVTVLVVCIVGVHAAAAAITVGWQHDLNCKSGGVACWFDISYPQCGRPYPAGAEIGIVGVNHGKVFSVNPCLSAGDSPQLPWAGGVDAQFYVNTGNPGPDVSTRWPSNQETPRVCDTPDVPGPDTAECAFDYGWNAAADSYQTVVDAYIALGLAPAGSTDTPRANQWWLDVETVNSWRSETDLNVAVLQGEVAYLESVNVAGIGFYSTQYQWNVIAGGTKEFSAYPSWVAGAGTVKRAASLCGGTGFTGGRVAMAQYLDDRFDADFVCPS